MSRIRSFFQKLFSSSTVDFERGFFWKYVVFSLVGVLGLGYVSLYQPTPLQAEDCAAIVCSQDTMSEEDYFQCNKKKQACWEQKISETQSQATTLTNTINLLNGQISLQQLQVDLTLSEINTLEKEVIELSERIKGLGFSLDRLSTVLIERARTHYKSSRALPVLGIFGSDDFSDFITRTKYLLLAQKQTVDAMEQTETQRLEYDDQKQLKQEKQLALEVKKQELEVQEAQLAQQKNDQQFLLNETKNNEAKYQSELAKTLAELQAIQSIIAGKGNESKVGQVSEGETIASIIPGVSACSTGAHLHFEVVKDGSHRDPAGYLSNTSINWYNSPDGAFGFGGGWRWPVNNAAGITQGYGLTHYARTGSYGWDSSGNPIPHTGLDLVSKTFGDYSVKAVRAGTLYRGSIACGGGLLRYVRVDHSGDAEDTFYLHINY